MKRFVCSLSVTVLLMMSLLLVGCQAKPEVTGVWADAIYTEDTALGEGDTALTLVVSAEDKSVTLTVNTDQETVGAALVEAGIVEDADGDGLFTVVNGMTADYNIDQTYWAFYEGDAYANQGLNDTAIDSAVVYKLERSK